MKKNLIVFEGIDGVGKTSTARQLKENLLAKGIPAVFYEEYEDKTAGFNTLKPFIKKEVPPESSLFFYVASSLYKTKLIKKLLEKQWVICDRYIYSTFAYHLAKGVVLDEILDVKKIPVIMPDYYFLLKAEEETRIKRLKSRSENNPNDFIPNVKGSFLNLMEQTFELFNPTIIDNSRMSLQETVERVMGIIGI